MINILTDTETLDTIIGSNVKYRYLMYIEYYTALSGTVFWTEVVFH